MAHSGMSGQADAQGEQPQNPDQGGNAVEEVQHFENKVADEAEPDAETSGRPTLPEPQLAMTGMSSQSRPAEGSQPLNATTTSRHSKIPVEKQLALVDYQDHTETQSGSEFIENQLRQGTAQLYERPNTVGDGNPAVSLHTRSGMSGARGSGDVVSSGMEGFVEAGQEHRDPSAEARKKLFSTAGEQVRLLGYLHNYDDARVMVCVSCQFMGYCSVLLSDCPQLRY